VSGERVGLKKRVKWGEKGCGGERKGCSEKREKRGRERRKE
jgi:hypothetical protein